MRTGDNRWINIWHNLSHGIIRW